MKTETDTTEYPMKDRYWCCGVKIGEQHAGDCTQRLKAEERETTSRAVRK